MNAANRMILLTALLALGARAAGADTLFVAGAVPLSSGDTAVVTRLEALGESVTVVRDSTVTATSGNGRNLIVISDTVAPAKIANKLRHAPTPVIVFQPRLYDDFGMTGTVSGTDFGKSGLQTQVRVSGSHPLAAGLAGVVTVENSPANLSWGAPGPAAVVAATLKGNVGRAAVFGYEAGNLLKAGIAAPARRVGFYANIGATDAWNANGVSLFDAAVRWARDDDVSPPLETVRILPLGDSITHGRAQHWTYRRNLEIALEDAGCSFDYVGSQTGPANGPAPALSDRDNEGHSGLRTDEVRSRLHNWLPGNDHDWALIHLGTNDVLQGTSLAAARTNLSKIIDELRGRNSHVGILIAEIIPNLPANESAVVTLNDSIASLAAEKSTAASPVIAVDQYSGYNAAAKNYDGIHPNDAGEASMAQRWADALLPRITSACSGAP
jgi:lysophospholipase L1-like esterase